MEQRRENTMANLMEESKETSMESNSVPVLVHGLESTKMEKLLETKLSV
jgi:hypothetical protein